MTIDTFLGLFGAITGVIGLLAAYYFYRKSIRTKVLGIAFTDPIPILMTLGNLEVIYEGFTVSALSRVYILFWNRGTAAIEATDFLAPIKIGVAAPILNLQIHDKDAAASATLNEKDRELSIGLLRPGEAITLVAEVNLPVVGTHVAKQRFFRRKDFSDFGRPPSSGKSCCTRHGP
jgi:hypothetical protein